jgi:hypothetical protein
MFESNTASSQILGTAEASAIAEEAYVYAYPMLLAYGFFHAQICAPQTAEAQAINRLTHFRRLGSPDFNNTIPWINTDTPYSAAWLDLRTEPYVLSVPAFEPHRFQNIQLVDWYTHNFANRGTRSPGNKAAQYLIAGPDWHGEKPRDIDEVIRSETWLVKLVTRILLESPDDYPSIHALQDRYGLLPLSQYLGKPAPAAAPRIEFPTPTTKGFFETPSVAFIPYFNFLLTLTRAHASEGALFERFARIGIDPGDSFHPEQLTPTVREAVDKGVRVGYGRIMERLKHLGPTINCWQYPLDLRGDRSVLAGSHDAYLRRAVAARYAIWGPSAEEVVYLTIEMDTDGEPLDGSKHHYVLDFDKAPPAQGFWSFTVYDAKTRLLVKHPSGRYKLGDRDRGITHGTDGSFRFYLGYDATGEAGESNWLPVPKQPFQVVARFYWPTNELLDGSYLPPGIEKVN